MTERVYLQIDDEELTALLSKLDTSMKRMRKIDEGTFKLDARSKAIFTDLESLRVMVRSSTLELSELTTGLDETMGRLVQVDLYGKRIDVDMFELDARTKRIIARLPGLREADMLWREIQAMGTIPPGPGGILALGTTLFMLWLALKTIERRIIQIEREIIRSRAGLEDMVREGMDLTHEEYLALGAEVVGYATPFDEFIAKWEAGEYMDAIADYVIALIPSRIPTYAGRLPYDPTTIPPEVEEHWLYLLDQRLKEALRGVGVGPEPYILTTVPPEVEEHWLKMLDEFLKNWWKNLWRGRGKANEDTDYEYNMNIGGPNE